MHWEYKTKGTCSQRIQFDIEDGIVKNVSFTGGCNGNLQGICKLVNEMKADTVVEKLQGIRCGMKSTSCPDQLATAIQEAIKAQ